MPTLSSPLAQTFTVEGDPEFEVTGRYLTSVDVYFAAKDDNLPITLEIRTVLNGYPGNKVLPGVLVLCLLPPPRYINLP